MFRDIAFPVSFSTKLYDDVLSPLHELRNSPVAERFEDVAKYAKNVPDVRKRVPQIVEDAENEGCDKTHIMLCLVTQIHLFRRRFSEPEEIDAVLRVFESTRRHLFSNRNASLEVISRVLHEIWMGKSLANDSSWDAPLFLWLFRICHERERDCENERDGFSDVDASHTSSPLAWWWTRNVAEPSSITLSMLMSKTCNDNASPNSLSLAQAMQATGIRPFGCKGYQPQPHIEKQPFQRRSP